MHTIACIRSPPLILDEAIPLIVLANGTANETGPASSNETCLATSTRVAGNCRRVTNVLMVTTTVRVIDCVEQRERREQKSQ